MTKCELCDRDNEYVEKCICCGKPLCYEEHAEVIWIELNVSSDCGLFVEPHQSLLSLYLCMNGHSAKMIIDALRDNINKRMKFKIVTEIGDEIKND